MNSEQLAEKARRAFTVENLTTRPVAVALLVFGTLMAVMAVATVLASSPEAVLAAVVYRVFQAVVFLTFLVVVLRWAGRHASAMAERGMKRRAEREAKENAAIQKADPRRFAIEACQSLSSEEPQRSLLAVRLLEDDAFLVEVARLLQPKPAPARGRRGPTGIAK